MMYLAFLLFTFVILFIAFYQWQYFMVFSPLYYRGEELGDDFELLSITTDDGVELEGVVYEPKELYRKLPSIDATLLFFGGRSHDSVGLIKKLSEAFPHTRIITFNYRSYGKSGGAVSEKNILSDGLLIAKKVQENYGNFYLLGFSLGSLVASYIASKQKVAGVFLVGSFDSVALLAKEKYGFGPAWMFRYKLDNTKHVQNIDAHTYLFVSKEDETTFIQNARNLKNHVKNLVHYKELENLSHKELLWDSGVLAKINEVLRT
ncbi:MAG: alpha/beta hydrolase [Sulfurimonas sp.]|nr:alpha/beta hydrolase [Sulfurimonas sp.]MDD5202890.1 alpha/beta hydrolase [Sulfurimonas sp.]